MSTAFQCACGDWYAKSEAKAIGHTGELLCRWCAPELGFCVYDPTEFEAAKCETRRAQARSAAREDGAKAARFGLSRDVNPHGEGTEPWRAWDTGWREHHSHTEN